MIHFFLMKMKNFKWHKRTDLQHSFLVASKHGMGACQCDRKTLAVLSFLKPGFDTNSLHTRQMYLIDSAFAPKQLPVCWNKHIEYVEERRGEHLIFTEHLLCTRHCIRYWIYNIFLNWHYSAIGLPNYLMSKH